MKMPNPSHRERIGLFRLAIVGDLLARDLAPGELKQQLLRRSRKRYRAPGAPRTRTYSFKTLQRWYYAARDDLAGGLVPQSRVRGHALRLSDEQRRLLLEMRQEHPSAAAEMLLSEAIRHGVVAKGDLTLSTLRRLYRTAGLPRAARRRAARTIDVQRRRWQAEHPGQLWHGDVCHLALVDEAGRPRRILVHGLLDDASRYCAALVVRGQERERDMLEVLCGALLRHPAPDFLYLDNGSTYRGDILQLVCKRLDIGLIHAQPYSPQARGKMERLWRTMRQRCTDHLSPMASFHQVGQALWAWLDTDYHRRPHGALMGQTPRRCYLDGLSRRPAPLTARQLARALEVSVTRQVRLDATFSVDRSTYEVSGRHLAGKRITVVVDALTGRPLTASWQDQPVRFGPCDPVHNRNRPRAVTPASDAGDKTPASTTPFDPIAALLHRAR